MIEKGEYKRAAEEYARLLSLESDNDSLRLQTVVLFRKAGLQDSVSHYLHGFEASHLAFEREYALLLLATENWVQLQRFVATSSFTENEKQMAVLHQLMFAGKWKKAQKQLEHVEIPEMNRIIAYNKLVEQGIDCPKRSIALAVVMSALVPGLGKVYSGAPWEGLSTFVITGFLAFSAYRGFIQKEEASILGWLYGAGFVGFYAGNIYGTVKQVKKFNLKHQQKLKVDVEELVFE